MASQQVDGPCEPPILPAGALSHRRSTWSSRDAPCETLADLGPCGQASLPGRYLTTSRLRAQRSSTDPTRRSCAFRDRIRHVELTTILPRPTVVIELKAYGRRRPRAYVHRYATPRDAELWSSARAVEGSSHGHGMALWHADWRGTNPAQSRIWVYSAATRMPIRPRADSWAGVASGGAYWECGVLGVPSACVAYSTSVVRARRAAGEGRGSALEAVASGWPIPHLDLTVERVDKRKPASACRA
jgi:hypothetical protein